MNAGDIRIEPDLRSRSIRTDRHEISRYRQWLTAAEIDQAARFRLRDDHDRFILGRGLAREMIGDAAGCCPASLRFTTNLNGKPMLADLPELAFNVSHSGDIVMVAVARAGALGVDVEKHRSDIDLLSISRLILTSRERAIVASASLQARVTLFFRQWVFKEALVKALGTGLSRDPQRFQITFDGQDPELAFIGSGPDDVGGSWILKALPAPQGYSAALAMRL